jgi:TatD DNase family protein
MLFDSHCHLTADDFAEDRDVVLERARAAGVMGLVTIASDPDDADRALSLARRESGVWSTAGLHPHEAGAGDPSWVDRVRSLLREPEVVAVGECGLDFHYDHAPRARQREVFEAQIGLAAEMGLPLVVHSRDADQETIEVLLGLPPGVRGVLHCFTGGDHLLETALAAGWWVSFSGLVTFKRFDAADRVRRIPEDRLLIETDSPYLAPVPHRGERNEPARLVATAAVVAELRGTDPAALAAHTTRNAREFYAIEQGD